MAEDGKAPLVLGVKGPAEVIEEGRLGLVLLDGGEVFPFLGLGLLDERDHILGEEASLLIEGIGAALLVTGRGYEMVLDGGFEGDLLVVCWHQATSSRTSILPVTAADMRAVRYSRSRSMLLRIVSIILSIFCDCKSMCWTILFCSSKPGNAQGRLPSSC